MVPAISHLPSATGHIHHLAADIGGRGSCTPSERAAAHYAAAQMRALGLADVRIEPFRGAPSTYRPYALAFLFALLAVLAAWLAGGRWGLGAAALLAALGAWGMLAESDLAPNWMRLLLPRAGSQNAVGVLPPESAARRRVVLCAHLDTHRTPIFYASRTWNLLFAILVPGAFAGMALSAVAYALGALLAWEGARWIGTAVAPVILIAFGLCLSADLTPFSPGANDNASGVAAALDLAARLRTEPLRCTEVWFAFTGCEEVGAYGMAAFLDAHAAELGKDAVCIALDQVGVGRLIYLSADGLVFKRRTHPHALALARAASAALPDLVAREQPGLAYTDALVATKRGLAALTLCALPEPGSGRSAAWHQMSDTPDIVDLASVAAASALVLDVFRQVDRSGGQERVLAASGTH